MITTMHNIIDKLNEQLEISLNKLEGETNTHKIEYEVKMAIVNVMEQNLSPFEQQSFTYTPKVEINKDDPTKLMVDFDQDFVDYMEMQWEKEENYLNNLHKTYQNSIS